jgi:hypothetical protein
VNNILESFAKEFRLKNRNSINLTPLLYYFYCNFNLLIWGKLRKAPQQKTKQKRRVEEDAWCQSYWSHRISMMAMVLVMKMKEFKWSLWGHSLKDLCPRINGFCHLIPDSLQSAKIDQVNKGNKKWSIWVLWFVNEKHKMEKRGKAKLLHKGGWKIEQGLHTVGELYF